MAAYAALITLINLIEDMQNHPRLSTSLDQKQIESLGEKLNFLLNFIETYNSHGESKEAGDLERQIASAAQEAEDVIESHIVNRILAGSGFRFLLNVMKDEKSRLQKVMKYMDTIKEKIVKIEEKAGLRDDSVLANSSRPSLATRKTSMVGFDDELIHLMDALTGQHSTRQIISIVGMCGMGKTTLTRNAFENSLTVHHFDIRAWATISQKRSAREIFLKLLSCEGNSTSETYELGLRLHQTLSGRRYLIILDDIWDLYVWDQIRNFLPDNDNGSRIVMTTRHVDSRLDCVSFQMNFLDNDNSWKLLCEKAFGEDDCPSELVEIGKKIVEQCRGLPLSIVVIGGYLSKSSRTKEYWEYIVNNINSVLSNGEDARSLKILSLSYNHLPASLKPCFLYTGIFSQDEEIIVSKLIRLWVAEGFLKPNETQSLEEVAESYLKDLVDRNLILVHKWGLNGKIITCKIHDLVRELCLKVALKEKFLCVLKFRDTPISLDMERRVVIHGGSLDKKFCHNEVVDALKSAPLVRSLMCNADQLPSDFKLLKVQTLFSPFPNKSEVIRCLKDRFRRQVNLRYLDFGLHPDEDPSVHIHETYSLPRLNLPSSISRLWNLQTLILGGNFEGIVAPPDIWKMSQLRHLVCNRIRLPDPPSSDQQKRIVMQNLQTLTEVEDFNLSEEVCKRIPNIKKLRLWYSINLGCLSELKSLTKLESLTCEFSEGPISCEFAQCLKFPSSLQELCLVKCSLGWENLTVFGSLPNLEVLKLGFSVQGNEWNPVEGEFERLKYLEICSCDDLINWNAERSHFPVLESLTLRGLSKLSEVPSGIGDIPTLKHIQLEECSVSAAVSAMRILVEQESFGNEDLRLEVWLRHQEDQQSFREMVQEEDLNSNNLCLVTA